nr:VRR-NUC domain-containing protein [Nitrospira sp.]
RMGLRPGAADLCIIVNRQVYFMELKAPKGVQSPEQRAFEDDCKEADIPYVIVRSIDLALTLLKLWGALQPAITARRAA